MPAWVGQYWVLIAALAAVLGYGLALYLLDRRRPKKGPDAEQKTLFAELAGVHGLSGMEQRLLMVIAETNQLVDAAQLFIDPAILQQAGQSDSDDAPAYAMLLKKLYGDALA